MMQDFSKSCNLAILLSHGSQKEAHIQNDHSSDAGGTSSRGEGACGEDWQPVASCRRSGFDGVFEVGRQAQGLGIVMRGMGRIYRRGTTYWIQYSHRGRTFRELSHSDRETVARKLLKKRLGETGVQKFIGPAEERVTFEDLAATLLTDDEVNAKRSIRGARLSLQHLRCYFGTDRALDITMDRISAYKLERQRESAANGSINRELAALKRAFRLMSRPGG